MWDLNDSPDQRKKREEHSEEGCSSVKTSIDEGDDEKGKRVDRSVSNSSSSAVVIEDGSEEDEAEEGGAGGGDGRTMMKKRSSKIFGFSVTGEGEEESLDSDEHPPVTRQFFPVGGDPEKALVSGAGASSGFPRAHWVGVKFCQSEAPGAAGKSVEVSQPMKKSRRGPRSRSSQYRGVTFYRRTGRWESHIWLVSSSFQLTFLC